MRQGFDSLAEKRRCGSASVENRSNKSKRQSLPVPILKDLNNNLGCRLTQSSLPRGHRGSLRRRTLSLSLASFGSRPTSEQKRTLRQQHQSNTRLCSFSDSFLSVGFSATQAIRVQGGRLGTCFGDGGKMGWSFGFLRISKVLQTPLGAKLAWRAEQAKFRWASPRLFLFSLALRASVSLCHQYSDAASCLFWDVLLSCSSSIVSWLAAGAACPPVEALRCLYSRRCFQTGRVRELRERSPLFGRPSPGCLGSTLSLLRCKGSLGRRSPTAAFRLRVLRVSVGDTKKGGCCCCA